MSKSLPLAMTLEPPSIVLPSTLVAIGSLSEQRSDGKYGTLRPRIPLSLEKETSISKERKLWKKSNQRRPKLKSSIK